MDLVFASGGAASGGPRAVSRSTARSSASALANSCSRAGDKHPSGGDDMLTFCLREEQIRERTEFKSQEDVFEGRPRHKLAV